MRTPPPPPFVAERRTAGAPTKRKRVTPFISKKVAARQGFKCAMCGELLQEAAGCLEGAVTLGDLPRARLREGQRLEGLLPAALGALRSLGAQMGRADGCLYYLWLPPARPLPRAPP